MVFCDLNISGLPCLDLLEPLIAEIPQAKFVITETELTCEQGEKLGACFCPSNPISAAHLRLRSSIVVFANLFPKRQLLHPRTVDKEPERIS